MFGSIEQPSATAATETGISARVIADSISEAGARLTTMVWRYPRFIHSEIMTHRMLSRNAASSRAIPVEKMIAQVLDDPAVPVYWGKNQAGMQAREELTGHALDAVKDTWLFARDRAVASALALTAAGLHKQIANRILEPWMWMVCLVTATEWDNFFHLRTHPDAQPEFQVLAKAALAAMNDSHPIMTARGGWHLPFVRDEEKREAAGYSQRVEKLIGYSVARCARVSYLNHDKTNPDPVKDLALAAKLQESGHMSPFEHVATPLRAPAITQGPSDAQMWSGNFRGWAQYRKTLDGENRAAFADLKKHGVAR